MLMQRRMSRTLVPYMFNRFRSGALLFLLYPPHTFASTLYQHSDILEHIDYPPHRIYFACDKW